MCIPVHVSSFKTKISCIAHVHHAPVRVVQHIPSPSPSNEGANEDIMEVASTHPGRTGPVQPMPVIRPHSAP